MRRLVNSLRALASSLATGFSRKLSVLRTGSSIVSPTCQVPRIRELYRELALPSVGVFVEVGGFDGESWSNTSFLADEGWRGLYIEPVPTHARLIRARHLFNKVKTEQVAVGERAGPLRISQMGALSTAVDVNKCAYREIEWAKPASDSSREIVVRSDTLQAILSRHRVPSMFDLMVIDVEGGEEAVVDALIGSIWRPRVLVAELEDRHESFSHFPEIVASHRRAREKLTASGYDEHYSDPINTIFVYSSLSDATTMRGSEFDQTRRK